MSWVTMVTLLLQIALQLIKWLESRRALEQAELEVLVKLSGQVDAAIKRAQDAAKNVDPSPDAIARDPDNRDRQL